MIRITRFFYIHILVLPVFLVAYFVGVIHTVLMAYCIVTVHELFHLFAALFLRVRVGSVIVLPFGMTLRLSNRAIKSPGKECIIALAGPFSNLLMLLIGEWVFRFLPEATESLFLYRYLNLITLFLNLLPVLPLDGGRVMRAALTHFLGLLSGMRIMRRISRIGVGLILFFGILLLVISKCNLSLLAVGAFLAVNLTEEKKREDCFHTKELLEAKKKLLEQELIAAKVLTVTEKTRAKSVMRRISYDSFLLLYVEETKRWIAETELVEALIMHGYAVKIGEIPSARIDFPRLIV